ncbi:GtrA family protein [Herminiimonas sp. NPDC097707]|uniref:GtrA family protein n=1 Tax=Herminiimonas sp. NPDC097707 TaxID=3364007 RepID=UPI00383AA263
MRLIELLRVLRFGIVGLVAAAVHYWVVIALVELVDIAPLRANVGGFVVAFWVSYFGHRHWTFADAVATHAQGAHPSFLRFLMVALLGFCMNELLFYLLLRYAGWPYYLALAFVVFTVAVMTYVLSRLWAFRHAAQP